MPELTPNHKDFVKAIIETKGKARIRRAYQKVYPQCTNLSANANAAKLLARDDIKLSLIEEFKLQGLSIEDAIREHLSLILAKPLKVTADTKLNAIELYYKLNSLLNTNSDSLTLNSMTIAVTPSDTLSLSLILQQITQLNESLMLKEQLNDSDNVIDNTKQDDNGTATGKE